MERPDIGSTEGRQRAIAELRELEIMMKRVIALYDEMLARVSEQYGEIAIQ